MIGYEGTLTVPLSAVEGLRRAQEQGIPLKIRLDDAGHGSGEGLVVIESVEVGEDSATAHVRGIDTPPWIPTTN